MIVTDFISNNGANEYILVAIQSCQFHKDEEEKEDEDEEKWISQKIWRYVVALGERLSASWLVAAKQLLSTGFTSTHSFQ